MFIKLEGGTIPYINTQNIVYTKTNPKGNQLTLIMSGGTNILIMDEDLDNVKAVLDSQSRGELLESAAIQLEKLIQIGEQYHLPGMTEDVREIPQIVSPKENLSFLISNALFYAANAKRLKDWAAKAKSVMETGTDDEIMDATIEYQQRFTNTNFL